MRHALVEDLAGISSTASEAAGPSSRASPPVSTVVATVSHPLRRPSILMVQTTKHGQGYNLTWSCMLSAVRHALRYTLVRARPVVVSDILSQARAHLLLRDEEHVVDGEWCTSTLPASPVRSGPRSSSARHILERRTALLDPRPR